MSLRTLRLASLAGALSCAAAAASIACGPTEPPSPPNAASSSPARAAASGAPGAISALAASVPVPSATPDAPLPLLRPPAISFTEALDITFADRPTDEASWCKEKVAPGAAAAVPGDRERAHDEARIRCLLEVRFASDAAARDLALGFYDKLGSVTGVIREHTMDGGWRGDIHLVPELPVGQYRRHLQWVKSGFEEIDSFFAGLDAKRPPGTKSSYRYKALSVRFLRSVGRTTPSAYASDWEVSYNVSGSLHANADAVRETLFHEVFHLNDSAHGRWSIGALTPLWEAILTECGQKTACLTPYAPGTTMVRGGTYYAFQKGNGVWEYAAELATRYYIEHRAVLRGDRPAKPPFKCGPPANRKAWDAIVTEFFGVDLTPPCAAK